MLVRLSQQVVDIYSIVSNRWRLFRITLFSGDLQNFFTDLR